MNTTIDELAAPAGEELAWMRPRQDVFEATETESVIDHRRPDDNVKSTRSRDRSLLKLLYELVVGMPAMADVQALRVWLCSPENRSVRLQLLMDDLPEKPAAGMELPLDDSIARWVWQHQRPLVIAAKDGSSFPDFARLLLEWGIKYFCAVPLMLANRRIGVLGLASSNREALRSFDLEFVQRGEANLANATKDDDELQDPAETHEGSRALRRRQPRNM
jgi:formate hydrogenlyase transcriptional activator